MIDLNDYSILYNNKSTLKETSKDNSEKNNIQYMTESQLEVIDFDKVKTQYNNNLNLTEEYAKSVDALMVNFALNKIFFIEFKNGDMKNEKSKVNSKVKDSLLIFCDIIKKNISYTRKNLIFILVYNESKNKSKNEKSKRDIAQHIHNKAKENVIRFGFEKLKRLYFKEVYTYTEKEFADYLQKITL